jgi:hypothetical protein
MQPPIFPPEALCTIHSAAADVIGALSRLRRDEQIALSVLLLAVVDQQDHPKDRRKLETVRDAICRVLEVIEPGLVTLEPVQ